MSWTPKSQALQCHEHRKAKLRSAIDTANPSSALLLTPKSQAPQCLWHLKAKLCIFIAPKSQALLCYYHRKAKLCFVIITEKPSSAVSFTQQNQTLQSFAYKNGDLHLHKNQVLIQLVTSANFVYSLLPMKLDRAGFYLLWAQFSTQNWSLC